MSDFNKYLDEQLKNPCFKKEWDNLETEFNSIQAIINAKKMRNMIQKEFSEKMGI